MVTVDCVFSGLFYGAGREVNRGITVFKDGRVSLLGLLLGIFELTI